MKKLLAGLFLLGSMLAFAAGEQRVPIEKMELNQQTSMVYVQGEQTPFTGIVETRYENGKLEYKGEYDSIKDKFMPKLEKYRNKTVRSN